MLLTVLFAINVSAEGQTKTIGYLTFKEHDTYCEVSGCDQYTSGEILIPKAVDFDGNLLPVTKIGMKAFYCCAEMSSIIIPDSITEIGYMGFMDCTNLKSVTIPDSVTIIGGKAFAGAVNLSNITLSNNLISIGSHAFRECTSIKNITIPDSVTDIDICAFMDCNNMTSVVIGKSLKEVNSCAFLNCNSIQNVFYVGTQLQWKNMIHFSIDYIQTEYRGNYYWVNGGHESIKNANIIFNFKGIVIDEIAYRANDNNSSVICCNEKKLDNIIIQSEIDYKGKTLPVTEIEENAFSGCSMKSITVPDTVASIGNGAFSGSGLTSITIPDSVTSIGDNLCSDCTALKDVLLGSGLSAVGKNMFGGCTALTAVTLPDNITSIDHSAFSSCTGLKKMIIPGDVASIGAYAFYDCSALESITLPNVLTSVGFGAFYGCTSLTKAYYLGDENQWNEDVLLEDANDVLLNNLVFHIKHKYQNEDDTNCIECGYKRGVLFAQTFYGHDGLISHKYYKIGDAVTVPNVPDYSDETYDYKFIGWDKDISYFCSGDSEYNAVYNNIYIDYTVKFYDYNGNTISEEKYHYGDLVAIPENPTRDADETYTYTFKGWDSPVTVCTGNNEYTAVYNREYIRYSVVFKDYDGRILSSRTYRYGDTVAIPQEPSRVSDRTCTYSFSGWDKTVTVCRGNTEYRAVYDSEYIDYTVTFKNYDGTVLSNGTYHYGDSITAPGTAVRPADNTYTYSFKGWNKAVATCVGNAEFTAQYNKEYIDYTVVFKDYDGTVLSSKTYHYGDIVIIPEEPERENDTTYKYYFNGWDKGVSVCTGNAEYTAVYENDYVGYTVSFVDYDGALISRKTYHYGEEIEVPPAPARGSDLQNSYRFKGWNKPVTVCTGSVEYVAVYDSETIYYTVKFLNYDGTVLSTGTYHYGDSITAPRTAVRPADNTYTYSFKGWNKAVTVCTGNAEITAQYNKEYIDYTVVFKDYDGTVLSSKTYHYGDIVIMPEEPERENDTTYKYYFNSWDKGVSVCSGNAEYTAVYESDYIGYTVSFIDYDGAVISRKTYHYGEEIEIPPAPVRGSDEANSYCFKGWNKPVTVCKGNVEYFAEYDSKLIEYTVQFKNYDGTVLSTATYHYGDNVKEPQVTPVREADKTNTYSFSGWDKDIKACFGNTDYIAVFDNEYISYTIMFKDYDNTVISSEAYHYGDKINAPEAPTRQDDAAYTYSFTGWNKAVSNCMGDAEYIAVYYAEYINYTVVFRDSDGTLLSSKTYHYGDSVEIPEDPVKPEDMKYRYNFNGWNKDVTVCMSDVEYVAVYNSEFINCTVKFMDYDGTCISEQTCRYGDDVTIPAAPVRKADEKYTYTFAGWNKDVTVCDGGIEYVAVYDSEFVDYTIKFVDYNGTVISEQTYHYGDGVAAPADPLRADDEKHTYTFTGWDKEITACTGDAVYTAVYSQTEKSVKVKGDCNGDGDVNNKDVVALFRYVSGSDKVEDESVYDFNGDGAVDNKDVVALFRFVSA